MNLLVLLSAVFSLVGVATSQDYVYTAGGEILPGRIVEFTEDGGVVFDSAAGGRVTIPADQLVAQERGTRSSDPFVVTEKAPERLDEASRRFAQQARESEKQGATTQASPEGSAAYKSALIAYERALVCLRRLVELYPQRAEELEPRLQALRTGRAMVSKFCGASLDLESTAGEQQGEPGDDPAPPGETEDPAKSADPRARHGAAAGN